MTRVVVTGGAGFLGSHLCERLVGDGCEVLCLDNFLTGSPDNVAHLLEHPRFRLVKADVTDYVHVPGPVDQVLHLASPASPVDYLQLPIETMKVGSVGTLHALGLAKEKGARFLLASTSESYGDPQVHPQPETYWGHVNPVGPRGVYDEAKRFAEALTMAYRRTHDVDTAIARIFNTHGPRMRPDDGRAVPTFASQALRGEPLTVAGDGSQTRSIIYVDDLVEGLVRLLRSDLPGPVNLGNPHEVSVLELARTVRRLTGSESEIVFVERPVDDPTVRQPDITLARTALGWEPRTGYEQGLARTLEWFRTHPAVASGVSALAFPGAGYSGATAPAVTRSSRVPDEPLDPPAPAGQHQPPDPYEVERPVGEECGVFGVWAPDEDVAKLTYYGMYALQHRGQEAAGMAVSDGSAVLVYKDLGLVAQVFDEAVLSSMRGFLAIGHTRYSTTGAGTWENAQPSFRSLGPGRSLALGHNGNLTNTPQLARRVAQLVPGAHAMGATTDSDLITTLLAARPDLTPDRAALEVLPTLRGAFCLVFMDERTLYAARDPHGVRPLVLGRLERGWVVASETAALDIVGASFVREVEPGELIAIDEHGVRTTRFAPATPKGCLFEYVYLARPDTAIAGQSVYTTRVQVGRTLAFEAPADADLVIPVPESGTPAAIGFAEQSGIPYGMGLVKNSYVGRTFIQPSQTIRQLGIRLKLNPLRSVVKGKRLVVVDDSIVRGNTQRALVRMLREAGAAEVHVRISSPPVMWPCFYGIDFASRAELIASGMGVEEIRSSIGADSLAFVSLAGLTAASGQRADRLCRACFDGAYPIEVPRPAADHLLEGRQRVRAAGSPSPAEHEHAPGGLTVIHNGVAAVDRMDALLPSAEEVPT